MTDLSSLSADQLAETANASLLHLQAWLRPGAMKWSRDGLDALAELRTRANQHDKALAKLQGPQATAGDLSAALVDALARAEAAEKERDEAQNAARGLTLESDERAAKWQAAEQERDEAKKYWHMESAAVVAAEARAVQAEQERDEAQARHAEGLSAWMQERHAAQARLAETQKALEFYANENNYKDGRPRWAHAYPSGKGIVDDNGHIARAALTTHPEARAVHVYCGNNTTYRGMFTEPDECNWEGDVPLPADPAEDSMATWVCPGCDVTNTVQDHALTTHHAEADVPGETFGGGVGSPEIHHRKDFG